MSSDDFECNVCYEIPRDDPFQMCPSLHNTCKPCYTRLPSKNCPVCKAPFDYPPRQNWKLKRVIESRLDLRFRCGFRDLDCDFVGTKAELQEHEALCSLSSYLKCLSCLKPQRSGILYVCEGDGMHNTLEHKE